MSAYHGHQYQYELCISRQKQTKYILDSLTISTVMITYLCRSRLWTPLLMSVCSMSEAGEYKLISPYIQNLPSKTYGNTVLCLFQCVKTHCVQPWPLLSDSPIRTFLLQILENIQKINISCSWRWYSLAQSADISSCDASRHAFFLLCSQIHQTPVNRRGKKKKGRKKGRKKEYSWL